MDIPAGPRAASQARRCLERLRADVAPGTFEDLRLLVSELVTNSARHAGIEQGAPIHVEVTDDEGCVRTSVADPGTGFDPSERRTPGPASGWGLHLVERLADRWGIEREPTTVWFELADRSRDS